ncbi:MAG: phospholipase D family protein [Schlesneria sp.]
MSFQLVDTGWGSVLENAMSADHSHVRIVCPFIKTKAVERLLSKGIPNAIQVITRFNLNDFSEGVSDISALQLLMKHGAKIRGVRNLHAKVYLFGSSRVVVTSANLTEAALVRNHEFGFVAEAADVVEQCRVYFDDLWNRGGPDLTQEKLAEWKETVDQYNASGAKPATRSGLPDEGVDAGIEPEKVDWPVSVADASQAFVKFFGGKKNRGERTMKVLDEIDRSGSHWACTYPKRPNQVQDRAVMYLARIVKKPNDILIYGRAIGSAYVKGRDDATPADIDRRSFKKKYSYYVRVDHGEFIDGTLANGISLYELMEELKSDAFLTTQANAIKMEGNTNPRMSLARQPAVQLSDNGKAWLEDRLQDAFLRHGKIPQSKMNQLDWPDIQI